MKIGDRIRQLRKTRKMTLVELSQNSGVQLATLSRIENLKMTGTLDSHISIAKALGVNLSELYKDIGVEEKTIEVQSQESRSEVFLHSDKAAYEMLTSKVLEKKMMPILLKIEPQGKTQAEQNALGAEKFVFCLEGKIEAVVDNKSSVLTKNATLYFDASLPHYFKNLGKSKALAICVITPPAL